MLTFLLMITAFPMQYIAYGNTVASVALDIEAKGISDEGTIEVKRGQKGIDYALERIELHFESTFQLTGEASLSDIRVTVNGQYDETDKFQIEAPQPGLLTLHLKEVLPGGELLQLRKHALYDIYIPQGTFQHRDGTQNNQAVHYTFVTKGETGSLYEKDILLKTTPGHGAMSVDYQTGQIVWEFIDEIDMDQEVYDHVEDYIQISSQPINPNIPSYGDQTSDSIANFQLPRIEGNKLILQAKENQFKDFAQYTVKLKNHTVYLKDSGPDKIYNGGDDLQEFTIFSFTTDQLLVSTQPLNGDTNVEVEPTLVFQFKYSMEILDKSKIQMTFEGQDFFLDPDSIQLVNGEGMEENILKISIHDNGDAGKYPLRRNTRYDVKIEEGALRLRDYQDTRDPYHLKDIVNSEMHLFFVTRSEGEAPVPLRYMSSPNGTDDIRYIDKSNLSEVGPIYIKFSTSIRIDKEKEISSLLAATHLYQFPGAETAFDDEGRLYDQRFIYTYDGQTYHAEMDSQELIVESVTVDPNHPDTLVIKPKFSLKPLNRYRLTIDKAFIEDIHGYNLEEDIDLVLWTKAAAQENSPGWSEQGLLGQNSRQDTDSTYPSYTVSGASRFGTEKPMVLYVDQEVIPKALRQQLNTSTYEITEDALKDINLTEGYDPTKKAAIEKCVIEYYFEGGIKKTKLSLYPAYGEPQIKTQLDSGKRYRLYIPEGTFETRSGKALSALGVNFTVAQDINAPKGIDYLESNHIKVTDLYSTDRQFTIKGFNFHEQVDQIILRPYSGNAAGMGELAIGREDIYFQDVTCLMVKLRGSLRNTLASESRTGAYEVIVVYGAEEINSGTSTYGGSDKQDRIYLYIESKGNPVVKRKYPESASGEIWHDEQALYHDVRDAFTTGTFFLKVIFEDVDGTLTLSEADAIKNCTVRAEGSGINMVDMDFIDPIVNMPAAEQATYVSQYLFVKDTQKQEAVLYIPVKALRPKTTYHVTVPANIVYFDDDTGVGNSSIEWSFVTTTTPFIKKVTVGSVPEDYEEDEPIYIKGDFFYEDTVEVYFNDIEASSVRVVTISHEEEGSLSQGAYLEVYLPRGRDRLEAGTYDIIIQNGENHQRIVYGSFSVVRAGDFIPNEEYEIKKKEGKGEVRGAISVSEDTLVLASRYADDAHVTLDLDEWMGKDVLVRKIQFEGSKRDTIGILETTSTQAKIVLYHVTLDPAAEEDEITICLGRVAPSVQQMLKQKLRGKKIKSDFIQVTGENYIMNSVLLHIPFENSNGKNLKVLRYDENTRTFYEEKCSVNLVDRRVEVKGSNKGIYVVVEK